MDALYKAGIESSEWADFVNKVVLEKLEKGKKKDV